MRPALWPVLLAACSGYRAPEDSAEMARDVEDRNLATRVRIALRQDVVTGACEDLRVHVRDGVVFLEGSVATDAQRARALQVAAACAGAIEVEEDLNVTASE